MTNNDIQTDATTRPRGFKARVKYECANTRKTRWWRFGIVAAIYTLWVIWLGNYWFLLGLPLLFDIYITGFIPLTWWKKSNNKVLRTVMGWVDAIVYALVVVYFIFLFIGQNYQIPSSSLEKTLLTGDYLWVNKAIYGPRVPITPIHFPLVHNKMPIIGTDSYLDWPQNSYRRLPGLRNVETGDIVVFNFPAGDTVATKFEESPQYYETLVDEYGWYEVNTNKEKFGDIKFRPVDRRTNFVKRAVGLPGQRLKIKDDVLYIDGKAQEQPHNVQFRYAVALTHPLYDELVKEMGITPTDVYVPEQEVAVKFLEAMNAPTDKYVYILPLTSDMLTTLKDNGMLYKAVKTNDLGLWQPDGIFPAGIADVQGWTLSNYGGKDGILIPKKGMTVTLTPENWYTYRRVIRNYENHPSAELRNGRVYIDGKEAKTYTFEMDYYFMMGDNRDMSQDSRFWGFVPEDHIVGTPMFVIASFDGERPLTDGFVRWDRILISANPDKK